MKMMQLQQFCEDYGIPYETARRLKDRQDDPLPTTKIGRRVYVRMDRLEGWLDRENRRNNKYA